LSQFTHLTDKLLIERPHLHSCNVVKINAVTNFNAMPTSRNKTPLIVKISSSQQCNFWLRNLLL